MKYMLKFEYMAFLLVTIGIYANFHYNWVLFAALFFAPDLSMVGYLVNTKVGAICYNIFHSYSIPLLIILIALLFKIDLSILWKSVLIIWLAHISFDRVLGYGMKYDDAFKHTHLSVFQD